jgi:iron complex outermembrane receptor protein
MYNIVTRTGWRAHTATASVAALLIGVAAHSAAAQTAANEPPVTGTRITRDGYEAPTPVTVVDIEQIQTQATANVADFINTLPALSGSQTPLNTQASAAGAEGINSFNLRNLGAGRTLVLLDGRRSVGATLNGVVDINAFPQQLISRVDIVTGGATAAYGSDAVAGVVNVVLDTTFTGVKGEISGGVTTYGDDRDYKVAVSAGAGFANGRGHLVISGELDNKDGILTPNRAWNDTGWGILNNPTYTAINGQPRMLVRPQVSSSRATLGGLVLAGPLKGLSFGPGSTPSIFNYGSLNDGTSMMGGDWKSADIHDRGMSLDTRESRQNLFLRAGYDVLDNINVYGEAAWAHTRSFAYDLSQANYGVTIRGDNAFLPPAVQAQMAALRITALTLGTDNGDLPRGSQRSDRITTRNLIGATGSFNVADTQWNWDTYFQASQSRQSETLPDLINVVNYALATDAVRAPNGAIVCRATLTNPSNGCVPFNVFGTGVNSQAARNYVLGKNRRNEFFHQNVAAASLHGTPFDTWAGPVSFAAGVEYRAESVRGVADPVALAGGWYTGNYRPSFGHYAVTEGFLETVVPLAKDKVWAKALDVNAAVRFSGYSTTGVVTTWKAGATYALIDDIRFRFTHSRDIRAANLQELFTAASAATGTVIDPFVGNVSSYVGITSGNPALAPEKADTTGAGVTLRPRFFPGLDVSVDYWNVHVMDAIGSVSAQSILNLCFQGDTAFCAAINRSGFFGIQSILVTPFNLADVTARGLDFGAVYRLPLASVAETWAGDLTLRAAATKYLENSTAGVFGEVSDIVGQNSGMGPPHWRWTASATYARAPVSVSLAARGVSSGTISNQYITCTSACPVATALNPTIDANALPGATYFDLAFAYSFTDAAQAFFNIKNLANKDPAITPRGPANAPFDQLLANPYLYDVLGRVFRAGVRFKM